MGGRWADGEKGWREGEARGCRWSRSWVHTEMKRVEEGSFRWGSGVCRGILALRTHIRYTIRLVGSKILRGDRLCCSKILERAPEL